MNPSRRQTLDVLHVGKPAALTAAHSFPAGNGFFFGLSKFPTFKKRAFFFKRTIEGISFSIKEVMLCANRETSEEERRKKKKKTRKQFICSAWRNLNSFMCIRLYTHTCMG